MPNDNKEQLEKLLKVFNSDRIVSKDEIEEVIVALTKVLANNKSQVETLNEETKAQVDKLLKEASQKLEEDRESIVFGIRDDNEQRVEKLITQLERALASIRDGEDGEDGQDADPAAVVPLVLEQIKLPEQKEVILDDGEKIVEKINDLSTNDDELKIDASHIKNLPQPQTVFTGGGATALRNLSDVNIAGITNNQSIRYNSANQSFEAFTASGTGDVSSNTSTSVDNEMVLFSGTDGKTIKRASGTGVVRTDSGVVSIDSDVTDLVTAASTAAAGKIEVATSAETDTGTDAARAVSPDGLAGSNFGERVVGILVSDPGGDAITTGDGKAYFKVPSSMDGMNLVEVSACVTTASTSGTPTIQIRNATQTADMLSTRITIDANETDSDTAAAAAVIDTGNDDVADGDKIHIDIDTAGTGTKGLYIELIFRLP